MDSDRKIAEQTKILIVDDQPENLRLLSQILVGQGYEVRKAINGSTALMGLKSFIPDLILLDINMPGLDGYEVCQKLKSDRSTRQIPIIFLSAFDDVKNKVKAFEVGGVDYITKPFQVSEVLARVRTQLKVRRFHEMREHLSKAIVHDLKNPLSVITLSSGSLLRRKCLTGKNLEIIQTINNTAQSLDSLLNDLLMIAKMDADRLILHRSEIVLNTILIDILKRFEIAAEAKQVSLSSDIPEINQTVSVDVNLFQRMIENLLSNALKFSTPMSDVKVKVDYSQTTAQVVIKVIDQGIGIKPELKKQIFDLYNTGDYVSGVSQIGLGLSFCRMVIDAHGGSIFVEDNYPQGSIFTVKL